MDFSSFSSMIVSTLSGVYPSLSLYVRVPVNDEHHLSSVHKSDEHLRIGIGVVGNAVALLLFAAPILTFKRVIKERSTGEFSCVPYVTALLNCLIYTWYGSPMVSNSWENLPLFTINGLGILLECSFVFVYISYASPGGKKAVYYKVAPVVAFFVGMVVSTALVKDHHLRKTLVGCIGLVASIAMYSSPLVVVKRVIKTKSVEFMPFSLSLFTFLTSSLWTAYGVLAHDLLLTLPNVLGCPISILQLVLYFMYRRKKALTLEEPLKIAMVEKVAPSKVDIVKENEQPFKVNVNLDENEEIVLLEANTEEHIKAPLIVDAEEEINEQYLRVDIQKIIEDINEQPMRVDVEKMIEQNQEQTLRVDIEKIMEEINEQPLRVDMEKIEEHLAILEENQMQMGLPIPLVVSVGA